MTMTTSVLHDDGIAIVALNGELDLAVSAQLDAAVGGVLEDGLRLVLLDLDGLTFCDSTGLGALLRTSRRVRDAGGTCVLAGAQVAVQRLLALTGVRLALHLEPEVRPALLALRASSDA
jgi:anti-sigma B factor antagonist